jgi:hypothetical protein
MALVVTGPPVAPGQADAIDQSAISAQLVSGDWSARRAAATRIGAIPASKREPVIIQAVANELTRLQQLGDLGMSQLPPNVGRESAVDYYNDLVDVAADATDPVVIRPLANALAMGHPVIDALARFGDDAVPEMLAALKVHPRPEFDSSAMYGFRLLVTAHRDLPASSRSAIAAVARQHLVGSQFSLQVSRAIDLAAVLKDPVALRMLEAIARANSPKDVGLILIDSASPKINVFENIRRQAAAALGSAKGM